MPIQYSDIISEHKAVRNNCGVFDVSHMGEITISGPDAERYVQYIFTNDIENAPIGKIYYGMMLYPDGGVVDDLLVYKMDEQKFFLVVNAANIYKDFDWICQNKAGYEIEVNNDSDKYGQIAVQGPESENVMEHILGLDVKELSFYTFKIVHICEQDVIISRTGYTKEAQPRNAVYHAHPSHKAQPFCFLSVYPTFLLCIRGLRKFQSRLRLYNLYDLL